MLLRKIIFYIYIVIYLILCPLIVARLLGFVYNAQTQRFEKTGLVYVSTNPPEATVYIDGREGHQKTPAVLRDLSPGEHFIRIEHNGYNDWERSIPVVARKATVLANTLLIPQQWPMKTISDRHYQNIYTAADDLLIATNPLLGDIDIYHTTQGIGENFKEENTYQKIPLLSRNSIYAEGALVNLYSSPKSPFILLEATIGDKHKFLWVNLKENPPVIEDISDLFPEIPSRIVWDNVDNANIYALYQNNVYRINVNDKAIFPQDAQTLNRVLGHLSNGIRDKFLINDKNDLLIREGKKIRVYPKEEFGKPQVYDITTSRPSSNMYFEEKNGELFYLDDGTGTLCAAQILPYRPILNIPIPETLRFNEPAKENAK